LFRRQIGEPYLKFAFLPLLRWHTLADIKGCSNLIAAIESGLPEPDPLDNIQTTISLVRRNLHPNPSKIPQMWELKSSFWGIAIDVAICFVVNWLNLCIRKPLESQLCFRLSTLARSLSVIFGSTETRVTRASSFTNSTCCGSRALA
jgi:hypothetical protein